MGWQEGGKGDGWWMRVERPGGVLRDGERVEWVGSGRGGRVTRLIVLSCSDCCREGEWERMWEGERGLGGGEGS